MSSTWDSELPCSVFMFAFGHFYLFNILFRLLIYATFWCTSWCRHTEYPLDYLAWRSDVSNIVRAESCHKIVTCTNTVNIIGQDTTCIVNGTHWAILHNDIYSCITLHHPPPSSSHTHTTHIHTHGHDFTQNFQYQSTYLPNLDSTCNVIYSLHTLRFIAWQYSVPYDIAQHF